jgi:hypothetical protein
MQPVDDGLVPDGERRVGWPDDDDHWPDDAPDGEEPGSWRGLLEAAGFARPVGSESVWTSGGGAWLGEACAG